MVFWSECKVLTGKKSSKPDAKKAVTNWQCNLNPLGFPKSKRLCKQARFEWIFSHAKRLDCSVVRLYLAQTRETESQVAIVAGKKLGIAVKRNQFKRRLREIYRLNQHTMASNMDIVFVAKPSLLAKSFQEAETEVIALLARNGFIKHA